MDKRDTVMTPKQIAEHNADIVSRLRASQTFVQSGLTDKAEAEKEAAARAERKAATKR